MRGNHRSPANSPHKGKWRGALMFSLICALGKQSWGWWFETQSRSLWRRCNVCVIIYISHGHITIGSASLARSIRIRFHFRHRTGRIRSVSDHRAGRVWRSRHRSKTPNCLPGARDQVPALFRNAIERRGASVDSNSGAPITQSTFNMLRRMANLLSLLNWWLHRYDNEDDYALFQV